MSAEECARAMIEYVRAHHNSRSDELMRLIAEYDQALQPREPVNQEMLGALKELVIETRQCHPETEDDCTVNQAIRIAEAAISQAESAESEPITGPRPLNKQVPELTISDECKYCAGGEPEWSSYAKCWIHRRPNLDKRCTRKVLGPCGELPESEPTGQGEPK